MNKDEEYDEQFRFFADWEKDGSEWGGMVIAAACCCIAVLAVIGGAAWWWYHCPK